MVGLVPIFPVPSVASKAMVMVIEPRVIFWKTIVVFVGASVRVALGIAVVSIAVLLVVLIAMMWVLG